MARVIDAILSLKDNFTPTLRRVSDQMQEHSRVHQRLGKDIESTGKSLQSFSKSMALVSAPLVGAAMAGMKLASEFTNGMAKVSTLVDTNVVDMKAMRKEITELSNATGVSVTDLAAAQYQCMSAGVEAGKSVAFLGVATKTAKAGFTDATTAINALTTVLNAYGKKSEEAIGISDQLMVAQNFGKTTINDMAQSLGNVIPIAAALNVSTEELFASIATLTRNGIGTSEAITGLKAAYSNIIKPSGEAQKMAAELGIEFNGAHLKAVGWAKFLQEVSTATGGNTEQMAQLFGSVEALNNVLVLAGKGSGDFAEALKLMKNSAGATQEGYEKLKTPSEETKIALNQLYNAGMELSDGLAPFLKATTMAMKSLAKVLNDLTPAQKEMLTTTAQFIIMTAIVSGVLGKTISMVGGMVTKFGNLSEAIRKAGSVSAYLSGRFSHIVSLAKFMGKGIAGGCGIAVRAGKAMSGAFGASVRAIAAIGVNSFNLLVMAGKAMGGGLMTVFRFVGIAARAMFMNPIGLAITAVIAVALLLIRNWDMIKNSMMGTLVQIVSGIRQCLGGIIQFVTGVFTGDWTMAWEGVKNIFGGAFNALAGIMKAPLNAVIALINAVITEINGISFTAPDFVPGVGGQTFAPHVATIPMLAKGTTNWRGGPAMVHDAGAEIIDLPSGSRVYPHDKSLDIARAEGARGSGREVRIDKIADTIVIREEADIQKIARALSMELQKASLNMA